MMSIEFNSSLRQSHTALPIAGERNHDRHISQGGAVSRIERHEGKTIPLFKLPGSERFLNLQQLVPSHFHNPWTVVAFALVAATVMKGIFDYAGTYLVNYAGFGMITDLRDNLYNAILRSSTAFFTKHSTGTLLSTMVNDIEKVQYAMSSVLAEFLQQFFTFLFTAAVVVGLGGKLAWVL